ncbi:tetratricopeptide repeat protein [Candidatus Poribacteria bacterium]
MRNSSHDTISISMVLATASCSLLVLCFFSIFLSFVSASSEDKFEEALELVEDMDYSRAVEILEDLSQKAETPETKGKYYYVAATCYRKLGHWAKAVSYYQLALETDGFMLADLARLHIATGYQNLFNYGAAIKWYETILSDHPGSSSAQEARYQLGECYYIIKRYEAAILHYEKFMEDYPEEERVREAAYNMGSAYQELGRWSDAYVLYQGMLRRDMKDEIAGMAVNKIRFLILSHPTLPITRDDRMYYGLTSYYAKQYKAAREELGKVIGDPDELSAKAGYFIAESYYREREYSTAIEQYTSVVKNYPQSEYADISQYQIALCHRKTGNERKSIALLAEFATTHPESELADNAEFQIAEYHREKERHREAVGAYGKVIAKYPDSDLVDDALWNVGWGNIKLRDRGKSKQALQQLLDEYPDSRLADSARFWMGVNHERMGEWQEAADAYRVLVDNRAWYYSDRAKRRIEWLGERGKISGDAASVQYEKIAVDESVPAWQNINTPLPARIQGLVALRVFDDAVSELSMATKAGESLESIYYNLSVSYRKMGDFNKSRKYAWALSRLPGMKGEGGAMPSQLHRMIYPIAFKDDVFSNSEKNDLDPLLILAIMREESGYEPSAISWAGAHGLIQVMPSTGRDIARSLKIEPFRANMLLQPEINIRMGTWYLAGQMNRLGKHVSEILAKEKVPESERSYIVKMLAAGAYNGGESRIRRWVKKYGLKDIDEFVESIPIPETKRYIKKVFNSYEIYKALDS